MFTDIDTVEKFFVAFSDDEFVTFSGRDNYLGVVMGKNVYLFYVDGHFTHQDDPEFGTDKAWEREKHLPVIQAFGAIANVDVTMYSERLGCSVSDAYSYWCDDFLSEMQDN